MTRAAAAYTILILAAGSLSLGLSGCYNATRTPSIGAGEVRGAGAARPSAEQQLLAGVVTEPPALWSPGRAFRITSPRITMALRGFPPGADPTGRTMLLRGFAPAPSLLGDSATVVLFTLAGADSVTLAYRLDCTPAAVMRRTELEVPFAVDCTPVLRADSLLRGRRLYSMTSTWTDSLGAYVTGRRYVPITVDSVTPGEPHAPLRVHFTPVYDPSFHASVTMTITPEGTGQRDFAAFFSLTDPRRRFPHIYPDVWELITLGKVQEGMTREECRLALGAPAEVKTQEYYGFTREVWTYGNGRFLVFEDNVLKSSTL